MTTPTRPLDPVRAQTPPLEDPRAAIGAALAQFLAVQRAGLLTISAELAPVLDLAQECVSGGKLLRPSFCYWGWAATGEPPLPGVIRAAASLELLQACALIHDDVMDGSDTRRGRPSAHRQFERDHRERGWRGDPTAFGAGAAILLGDLFLTWSDQLFAGCGLPPERVQRGRKLFDAMRAELMAGQYLDLVVQRQPAPSRELVGVVLQYKSAKYTIEHPLQLGALLAGAGDDLVAGLGRFGLPLGEAFQLRDDLLGVFGDPGTTGKPAGDDLREGKQTLLVAEALAAADPSQAQELQDGIGRPDLSAAEVDRLREILQDTGAADAVEQHIADRFRAAMDALAVLPLPEPARTALTDLAAAAVHRVR